MALAIKGGTAFPTCVYCGTSTRRLSPPVVLFPKNSNESSKDWHRAISLTLKLLGSQGLIKSSAIVSTVLAGSFLDHF